MRYPSFIFALCFSLLALPAFPPTALAADYSVAPFVIDKEVVPRDILTDTIVVKNNGGQPVSLYPSVHGVSVGTDGGLEEFIPASMVDRESAVTAWIEISRRGMDLQPGESREIPVTFRIPPNALGGTYHAFIGFGHGRTEDDAKALVLAGEAPGTMVNISVETEVNEFLKLSKFLINRFVTKGGGEDVSFSLENTGDTPLMPSGDILLFNHRGEEVGSIPVNPDGTMLAPGSEATFTAAVPMNGLLGKYKALLSVEYGATQKASINDTVYFYVLPWKKILIAFGVFLLIAVAFSLYLHRRYLTEDDDDGSDLLPLELKEGASAAHPHDIVMKK